MIKTSIVALLVVLIISCGGGSSSPADTGVLTIGAVEKLGSIYVTGVLRGTGRKSSIDKQLSGKGDCSYV